MASVSPFNTVVKLGVIVCFEDLTCQVYVFAVNGRRTIRLSNKPALETNRVKGRIENFWIDFRRALVIFCDSCSNWLFCVFIFFLIK